MNKIVVIGSSNTDMVFRTSKFPAPGETVMGASFFTVQGGKGANQAVAAARAGGKVTFIAKVGNDDFGKSAIEGYEKDKINIEKILIDPINPTGVAVILVNDNTGQNSIVVAGGANNSLSVSDLDDLDNIIKDARILLVQLETPLDVVNFALWTAKNAGVKTILNPAPARMLSPEVLKLVDIITPNETETEILTGILPIDGHSAKQAATILLQNVNEAVLITMGSKGVYFLSKSSEGVLIPSYKVNAIDTTAAGDVFNGYLASALANDLDIEHAIRRANKAASISVTRQGAQTSIPFSNEVFDGVEV